MDLRAAWSAAWRDGVGPEELDAPVDDHEHAVFAALARLLAGVRTEIPGAPTGQAGEVVHAVALVLHAVLGREVDAIARAVERLEAKLAILDDDPRAEAAFAWADLAFGEVALALGEQRVAERRFDELSQGHGPVALRIHARMRLVELALERRDLEAARLSARKATALATAADRAIQSARARQVSALLDYAVGDLRAMREHEDDAPLPRLLRATAEEPARAMALLAQLIEEAASAGDPLTYALAVAIALRRYHALGRHDDARVTRDAAAAELAKSSPLLANLLDRLFAAPPPC